MAAIAHDEVIDELLVKYLELLDQYTTLRKQLNGIQSNFHHSLARANFSAERGARYGQDFYDERMQASVLLTSSSPITASKTLRLSLEFLPTSFSKSKPTRSDSTPDTALASDVDKLNVSNDKQKSEKSEFKKVEEEVREEVKEGKGGERAERRDPIRMFGLLTPPALRQAQASSKNLVSIVVDISNVDKEMRGVEIEVRRARKRKVKGEKDGDVTGKAKNEVVGENGLEGERGGDKVEKQAVPRGGGCGRVAI